MKKTMNDSGLDQEVESQLEQLSFSTIEITPLEDFKAMLAHSIKNKKPLRIKCGIDPTNKDIHLGHLVPYRKMRQFQDLGHTGVVIIGDYTARIGDPSGKNESRPPLTEAEVKNNAKDYMDQVFTVLDPKKTEIRYQSEWFNQVGLTDLMKWAGETTVAKLLSHETFRDRLKEGHSLGLHELFYPVLQGIDSVYVKADVELGGTDQKFNVLMGRDYQRTRDMRPQVAILLPLVMGLCGTQKMSKSLGNYIGVKDEPFDKFGKVMSIPDNQMAHYYQYLANASKQELDQLVADLAQNKLHPNIAKKNLAQRIVSLFHGAETAQKMREQFESVFAKGGIPDDTPECSFKTGDSLLQILVDAKLIESNSEFRRLVTQNAVSIVDGDKITDVHLKLNDSFRGKVVKLGKRKFLKLV